MRKPSVPWTPERGQAAGSNTPTPITHSCLPVSHLSAVQVFVHPRHLGSTDDSSGAWGWGQDVKVDLGQASPGLGSLEPDPE